MITRGILFAAFIVVQISACMKQACQNQSNMQKTDYHVAVGGTFEIKLSANPTTGYCWQWANVAEVTVADTLGVEYLPESHRLLGSGGVEIWKFKAVRTGSNTLLFYYKRPWDNDSSIDSLKFKVQVVE